VRNVLGRLGDPADIAAEARYRFGVEPRKHGGVLEVSALILLLVGGIVIPLAGWLIGVVLLWVSRVWSTRDKLIGTLVVPGGLGLAFYLVVIASGPSTSCSTETDVAGHVLSSTCGGGGVSAGDILVYILLGALVVGPIVTTVYLARRMRSGQAPDLALDLG
jgi:hypothetical protein